MRVRPGRSAASRYHSTSSTTSSMTAGWSVEITPPARRELRRPILRCGRRVLDAIDRLVGDPPAGDLIKLQGRQERRLRVGDWRVLMHARQRAATVSCSACCRADARTSAEPPGGATPNARAGTGLPRRSPPDENPLQSQAATAHNTAAAAADASHPGRRGLHASHPTWMWSQWSARAKPRGSAGRRGPSSR